MPYNMKLLYVRYSACCCAWNSFRYNVTTDTIVRIFLNTFVDIIHIQEDIIHSKLFFNTFFVTSRILCYPVHKLIIFHNEVLCVNLLGLRYTYFFHVHYKNINDLIPTFEINLILLSFFRRLSICAYRLISVYKKFLIIKCHLLGNNLSAQMLFDFDFSSMFF